MLANDHHAGRRAGLGAAESLVPLLFPGKPTPCPIKHFFGARGLIASPELAGLAVFERGFSTGPSRMSSIGFRCVV